MASLDERLSRLESAFAAQAQILIERDTAYPGWNNDAIEQAKDDLNDYLMWLSSRPVTADPKEG